MGKTQNCPKPFQMAFHKGSTRQKLHTPHQMPSANKEPLSFPTNGSDFPHDFLFNDERQ